MSLLRKFVSRIHQRRRSGRNDDEAENLSPQDSSLNTSTDANKSLTGDPTKEVDKKTGGKGNDVERSSSQNEADDKATEAIDRSLKKAQKRLNKHLDIFRNCRLTLEQKKDNLEHLNDEVYAIKLKLENWEKQVRMVDHQRKDRLREMSLVCTLVPEEISPELRKKEPLYFKKFKNAKTLEEAQTVLSGIQLKQRALQHLETITFKKILQLENQLPDVSKNNNVVGTDMKGYVKDIMQRWDRDDLSFVEISPNMLSWESQPTINNVENLPTSIVNPVYESIV